MFQQLQRGITRSARLVLDVREWYASTFGPIAKQTVELPGARPGDPAQTVEVRSIVRPETRLDVTASPTDPRDPRWPFSGSVELVLSRSPAGLLAYFGRVRAPDGPLRRLPLAGARCRLRITAVGYQTHEEDVNIPAAHQETRRIVVLLMPAPDYPFPAAATTLRGWVVKPDGSGVAGALVTAKDRTGVRPAVSDVLGQWVLVLDREDEATVAASPVTLTFAPPGEAETPVAGVAFAAGRVNRMAQTSVRGAAVRSNGMPVAGATVTLAPLDGESTTRLDGTWLFYPGLDTPLSGQMDVTVRVKPPGTPSVEIAKSLTLGEANQVDPITIP